MKTEIEIKTTVGQRKVMAEVFGRWAVHESYGDKPGRAKWAVTYIPEGLSIAATLDAYDPTKRQAVAIAKALDARFPRPIAKFTKATGRTVADIVFQTLKTG